MRFRIIDYTHITVATESISRLWAEVENIMQFDNPKLKGVRALYSANNSYHI